METPKMRAQRRALSLVELLIIISVVALLMVIVIPSLNKVDYGSKQQRCAANLHGIAMASLTYAADDPNENAIPVAPSESWGRKSPVSVRLANYAYGGRSGRGGPAPAAEVNSPYGWDAGMGSDHRPLNHVIYKSGFRGPADRTPLSDSRIDAAIYKCPCDTGFAGYHYRQWRDTRLSSYDHFGTSYAANATWIAGDAEDSCRMYSNSPYLRPLSKVLRPESTILYIENAGRYCWTEGSSPALTASAEKPSSRKSNGPGWHSVGWYFNVAFADGHVVYLKFKGREPAPALPASLPACCATTDCASAMIRGRGWQFDTLPTPPIATEHPCRSPDRLFQDAIDLVARAK